MNVKTMDGARIEVHRDVKNGRRVGHVIIEDLGDDNPKVNGKLKVSLDSLAPLITILSEARRDIVTEVDPTI